MARIASGAQHFPPKIVILFSSRTLFTKSLCAQFRGALIRILQECFMAAPRTLGRRANCARTADPCHHLPNFYAYSYQFGAPDYDRLRSMPRCSLAERRSYEKPRALFQNTSCLTAKPPSLVGLMLLTSDAERHSLPESRKPGADHASLPPTVAPHPAMAAAASPRRSMALTTTPPSPPDRSG